MTVFPCERVGSGDKTKLEAAATLIQPVPFLVIMEAIQLSCSTIPTCIYEASQLTSVPTHKVRGRKSSWKCLLTKLFQRKEDLTIICVLLFLAHYL